MQDKEIVLLNRCNKLRLFINLILDELKVNEIELIFGDGIYVNFYLKDVKRMNMFACSINCGGDHEKFLKDCEFTKENIRKRIDSIREVR